MRSRKRPSQRAGCREVDEGSRRKDFGEAVGALLTGHSANNDSPKITDNIASSRPMNSRMTFRVIRCQKDSSSLAPWLAAVFDPSAACCPVCASTDSLMIRSRSTVLGARSGLWPSTLDFLLLRVSFSISSRNTLDCSILHFSILAFLSPSRIVASLSSTASSLLCTLDLLLAWPPIDLFLGLYCSKCHSCSCIGGLDAGKVPRPSCLGSIEPPCSKNPDLCSVDGS